MESALPVTLCYMLADLKAETEQHCHTVRLSHPSVSASDSSIIDSCTAQTTGSVRLGLKNNAAEKYDAVMLLKCFIVGICVFYLKRMTSGSKCVFSLLCLITYCKSKMERSPL